MNSSPLQPSSNHSASSQPSGHPSSQSVPIDPIEAYGLWADDYPPFAHNAFMLAEERAMLALIPASLAGMSVCDAGCGTGRYLIRALERGAGDLVGVDVSEPMLRRAEVELALRLQTAGQASVRLVQAGLDSIPLRNSWSDVTLCGLTLGHIESIEAALSELRRITKPSGVIICSDLHPVGRSLGWERTFHAGGKRYSVAHTWRTLQDWRIAGRRLGLTVSSHLEPMLAADDVPAGAHFDRRALEVPVALVFALRRRHWPF